MSKGAAAQELERENAKLKRLLAEEELDLSRLEGPAQLKIVGSQANGEAVTTLQLPA